MMRWFVIGVLAALLIAIVATNWPGGSPDIQPALLAEADQRPSVPEPVGPGLAQALEDPLARATDAREPRPFHQQSHSGELEDQDPAPESPVGDWLLAKEAMREDFMPTDEVLNELRDLLARLEYEEWQEGLLVSSSMEFRNASDLVDEIVDRYGDPNSPIQAADRERAEELAAQGLESLRIRADSACDLFEDAMLTYWSEEDYCRWKRSDGPPQPEAWEPYMDQGGRYQSRYVSSAEGWCAYVIFNSGDFPAFDDALWEAAHFKKDLAVKIGGELGIEMAIF